MNNSLERDVIFEGGGLLKGVERYALSAAISLKRIADAIGLPDEAELEDAIWSAIMEAQGPDSNARDYARAAMAVFREHLAP